MTNKIYNFTPDWLAGFTQADGSFVVSFYYTKKGTFPIRPNPIFVLTQSDTELELFKSLHKYLNIGKLQINSNRHIVSLEVKSINEIVNVIIPLLDKHPVRGNKYNSYLIFKTVSLMMYKKEHLTIDGLIKILELAWDMNKETSLRTQEKKKEIITILSDKFGELPIVKPILLPKIDKTLETKYPINIEFIRGLIDGDGSFNISFRKNRRRIGVNFTIISEISCISVLHELKEFLNCGKVYKLPSAAARYQVQTIEELLIYIYPLFKDIQFNTIKQDQFKILIEVSNFIKNKGYKSNENLKHIVDLAWEMNKLGKARRLSKEEYLNLFIST